MSKDEDRVTPGERFTDWTEETLDLLPRPTPPRPLVPVLAGRRPAPVPRDEAAIAARTSPPGQPITEADRAKLERALLVPSVVRPVQAEPAPSTYRVEEELTRIILALDAGKEPRAKTPEERALVEELRAEIAAIKAKGQSVFIPFGLP